jgi:ubiquinone/menaquinone biosynthesis C-methylase UbiE
MDDQTIRIYNEKASHIVARHLQHGSHPNHLEAKLTTYFRLGKPTADIGTGSGRDSQWLYHHGYPVVSYDGSEGMLAEARQLYPECDFRYALLPHLAEIPSATYTNVLCSFVLMHLPEAELPVAIQNLARILHPSGRLMVAFRPSRTGGVREADGRLFTPISPEQTFHWMEAVGLTILEANTLPSSTYENQQWHLIVAEKPV